MTDPTSDLHEGTIFQAEESTQNTEVVNAQNASVADCGPIDVHVEDEPVGEDNLQEGDAFAEEEETPIDEETGIAFADLGPPEEILDTVIRMGFTIPAPIRVEAIPVLLELNDVVGIAQTGIGKIAAFALPMFTIVDAQERGIQTPVLAPTRELATQSVQTTDDFASMTQGLDVIPVCGGPPYGPQISTLKRGAQVVVGTLGRIIDPIEKGALDLPQIRMLALDEVGEMLCTGLAEDVEAIMTSAPEDRLTVFLSVTIPPTTERIVSTHLKNPMRIAISEESSTVGTIHQAYVVVPPKHKLGALTRVLVTRTQHIVEGQEDADAAIVFVRTHVDIEEVSLEMSAQGFRMTGISSGVTQTERERMVERLRTGTLDILVATDVAARGLDVERISLVVNFNILREPEAYVHRIGCMGHAGREGRSLTFFTPCEHGRLRRVEKLIGTYMEGIQILSPVTVSEFRATRLPEGLNVHIGKGRLELYKGLLRKASGKGDNSILDLAAALMVDAMGDDSPKSRIAKDFHPKCLKGGDELGESDELLGASFGGRDKDRPLKAGRDSSRRRAPKSLGFTARYRVEVGKKDHVKPGSAIGAIAGEGGVEGCDIGHIEILPSSSLVEIFGELSEDQLS